MNWLRNNRQLRRLVRSERQANATLRRDLEHVATQLHHLEASAHCPGQAEHVRLSARAERAEALLQEHLGLPARPRDEVFW